MPNRSLATASDSGLAPPVDPEYGPKYQHQATKIMTGQGASSASETQHQEAYYLFFVGSVGITLNVLVIITILLRRALRRMTSAFLIHACFLNLLKAAYCIPFGVNLLKSKPPSDCGFEGSSYVVMVTTSAFNMVAMICAEAYTFGENNVGGQSRGTCYCVLFGVLMVYVCSLVLHLGPTLIGGYFKYQPDIGNCSFILGQITGYIANVMWILIISLSLVAVGHFLCKMYKEIQKNQPNRVSMLVRSSITIVDDSEAKRNSCSIRVMVKEASHRAKIFVMTVVAYAACWYPLFLLLVIDRYFKVSPKVYQAFSFIAWTQGTVEPIIYICFDRQLNLLARWTYCDRYKKYDSATLRYLMAQHRGPVPGDEVIGNTMDSAPTSAHNSIGYRDIVEAERAITRRLMAERNRQEAAAGPYLDDDDPDSISTISQPSSPPPLPPNGREDISRSAIHPVLVEPEYGNQQRPPMKSSSGHSEGRSPSRKVPSRLRGVLIPSEVQC